MIKYRIHYFLYVYIKALYNASSPSYVYYNPSTLSPIDNNIDIPSSL